MQPSSSKNPPSFLSKVVRAIRERPLHLWQYLRSDLLFRRTRLLRACFPELLTAEGNIELGPNVRVQRIRCLRVERPNAKIRIGSDSILYEHARLEAYGAGIISLGECTVLGDTRVACRSSIRIGNRVITSWNVFIQDFDPHPVDPESRSIQVHNLCARFHPSEREMSVRLGERLVSELPSEEISIGDDVWVGAGAMIFQGAKIGAGSVVAAGAIVLRGDYPARSVLAGNPARVVKTIEALRSGN